MNSYTLEQKRKIWRLMALALGRRLPVAEVTEHAFPGPGGKIELRIFKPTHPSKPRPAFLWCHGGGFLVGGLDSADTICRSIALAGDCITIAVRYRLAPEHELTAGREDFYAALEWVSQNAAALGVDATRLAIGGDSAGGNIAAAVAQESLRRGGPALSLQVLAYPATDLTQEFASKQENAEGYMISADMLDDIQRTIGNNKLDATDPWLSPRRSPDLRGLAPAIVITAGFDPIRDDGLDYTARLRAAGVPVALLHYAGQIHGFLNFDAIMGAGRDVLQRIGHALAVAFRGEGVVDHTVEIGDERPVSTLRGAGEVTTTALTAWIAVEGWGETLLRQVSPLGAALIQRVLSPVRTPVAAVRDLIGNGLGRSAARQTYPIPSP